MEVRTLPYKHPNISYGLPTDAYSKELTSEYTQDLVAALGLSRKPVGIKFIYGHEEYEALDVPEIKGKTAYCVMVEKASRGISNKSNLAHHLCDGATTALGLEPSNATIESGEAYFSYHLYSSKAAAHRMRKSIHSFHNENLTVYGLEIRPISEFITSPDVVILVGNSYQVMRIVQGYTYQTGEKPPIDCGAMQAVCSEATVVPYLTGSLNMSVFCPSSRMLSKWADSELVVGLPYEIFAEIVQGVMATINSTDIKKRKDEIEKRFKQMGKTLNLDQ